MRHRCQDDEISGRTRNGCEPARNRSRSAAIDRRKELLRSTGIIAISHHSSLSPSTVRSGRASQVIMLWLRGAEVSRIVTPRA
jgi:hypothetical protein